MRIILCLNIRQNPHNPRLSAPNPLKPHAFHLSRHRSDFPGYNARMTYAMTPPYSLREARRTRRESFVPGFYGELPQWLLFFVRGFIAYVVHHRERRRGPSEPVYNMAHSCRVLELTEQQLRKARALARLDTEIARRGLCGPPKGGNMSLVEFAAGMYRGDFGEGTCPAAPRVMRKTAVKTGAKTRAKTGAKTVVGTAVGTSCSANNSCGGTGLLAAMVAGFARGAAAMTAGRAGRLSSPRSPPSFFGRIISTLCEEPRSGVLKQCSPPSFESRCCASPQDEETVKRSKPRVRYGPGRVFSPVRSVSGVL